MRCARWLNNTRSFWGIIIYHLVAESKILGPRVIIKAFLRFISVGIQPSTQHHGTSFFSKLEAPWVNEMEIHYEFNAIGKAQADLSKKPAAITLHLRRVWSAGCSKQGSSLWPSASASVHCCPLCPLSLQFLSRAASVSQETRGDQLSASEITVGRPVPDMPVSA